VADTESWHLDKRVPIALIFTLLMQFSAGVWFMSSLAKDVRSNSNSIVRLDTQVEVLRGASQNQAVQLGRIEEQIGALRGDIGRLLTALERRAQ
jgi:TolA-binding protein